MDFLLLVFLHFYIGYINGVGDDITYCGASDSYYMALTSQYEPYGIQ